MALLKCDVCGGNLAYSLNSKFAVCENCGKTFEADFEELSKIQRLYRAAELKTYVNSADGYREAINQLQSISYVKEAREKIAEYESRLAEAEKAEGERANDKEKSDSSDGKIGVIIIVVLCVFVAFAIAGAAYIIYHLKAGDLSPTATAIIISVIAVLVVTLIISKIKS